MKAQDTKVLAQRIERELYPQAITEHEVAALVQAMAKANAGPLWSAAHNASDAGFRRLVSEARNAREDRELEARILANLAGRA
jgi:hypothetical protein